MGRYPPGNTTIKIKLRKMVLSSWLGAPGGAVGRLIYWARVSCQIVFGLAGVIMGGLYIFQDRLLYMPNPPGFPATPELNPDHFKSPGEWTVQGHKYYPDAPNSDDPIPFESAMLETSDHQRIHVWLMLQPANISHKVPTLIYFHGNAGNMGFRLQNAAQMYASCGINVLMMDYRGYGKSTGIPTETGLRIDASTVLSYAVKHPRLQGSPIVAFGRSLGGAVGLDLAQRFPDDVKAIILENTFLSISAMVDKLMPLVASLKFLVLRIGWHSDKSIVNLTQPIMFISGSYKTSYGVEVAILQCFSVGDNDELVPTSHMKKLYDLASKAKVRDFYAVAGGTHNDTWIRAGKTYYVVRSLPFTS
jgi:fermentation-respiration switch protein FrsA (DUF1100 family)